jgi:hypothetical protein
MVTYWQTDQNTVQDGLQDFGLTEDRPIVVDLTKRLAVSEPITNPVATFTLLTLAGVPEVAVPSALSGTPTPTGNVVSQRVVGANLLIGRIYELIITFGGVGNRRAEKVALRIKE